MQAIHDIDALLLLATLLAAKRRPAELTELLAAAELINGAMPPTAKLADAFARLGSNGLIQAAEGSDAGVAAVALTMQAQSLLTGRPPKRGEAAEQLATIKAQLGDYTPGGTHPPVQYSEAQLAAAIQSHQLAASAPGKNLLMPKPKPVETTAPRPGLRQRKPLPSHRRKPGRDR